MKLPVSGLRLRFSVPDGNDDLEMLESRGNSVERALQVLSRLAHVMDGDCDGGDAPRLVALVPRTRETSFWAELTVTDFETALLGLRQFLFGDTVACVFRDGAHGCGVRMELEFSIDAFLEDVRPRMPRRVSQSEGEQGWSLLTLESGERVRFRLPRVEDQLRAMADAEGSANLAARCIDLGEGGGRRGIARVERAMEAMAPLVSRPLAGSCPECGEALDMALHVPTLVMEELVRHAFHLHEETDTIAAAYNWQEAAILAMPQRRRLQYAETIRSRERVAV